MAVFRLGKGPQGCLEEINFL